jgi:hypothetical protein
MKKFKNYKKEWSTNTQAKLFTMKYYRFSRRRNDYFRYFRSKKKSDYIIRTGRSKVLDSGLFDNQVWGSLTKAWKGYVIAKNKDEYDKMVHYAHIIQESQYDLGLEISSFPDIGKSALAFHSSQAAQIARENMKTLGSNNQIQEEQPLDEENYQGDDQYEQERFTDAYNEYFEDDENKAERFTDDHRENFTD